MRFSILKVANLAEFDLFKVETLDYFFSFIKKHLFSANDEL